MRLTLSLPFSLVAAAFLDAALAVPNVLQQHSQLHVPLVRRRAQQKSQDPHLRARTEAEIVKRKYSRDLSKRDSGTNLLGNRQSDTSYYGSIAVGTPPVAFDVVRDTGSADLWLAQEDCTGCDGDALKFDASGSSSFTNLSSPFSITYGSGQASGTLGRDVVQLAGLQVTNQTFGICNWFSDFLVDSPMSGIMGMGWQGLASSGATPLWQALAQGNVLASPLFAFHLTRFRNVSSADTLEPGGTFTLGAVNNSLFTGDIDFQNIPQGEVRYWTLPLTTLSVNGNEVQFGGGTERNAVIDTGTTLVLGPSYAIAGLYAQIPGSSGPDSSGFYTYPCDSQPNVTMAFGSGPAWSVSPADFRFQRVGQNTCEGAFMAGNDNQDAGWIVGDTFLKNVYSVYRFNPPSVGFAALSDVARAFGGQDEGGGEGAPTPTIGSVGASVTDTSSTDAGIGMRVGAGRRWWWLATVVGLSVVVIVGV